MNEYVFCVHLCYNFIVSRLGFFVSQFLFHFLHSSEFLHEFVGKLEWVFIFCSCMVNYVG